ncbi:LysR family transcriptional regulator [Mycobacterium sp. B14F4]|uniref:LysR family transcriptional regulator n=1 Tax=Mycobacterium sp. B14F4 TaxID=3153565 RepID=UPI00325CBA62
MELRELRGFVAVVEEGGMSAAARRLHISQSALSQTISNLEHELGTQLLVRSSAGVRPTEAGSVLVSEARAVLARYAEAMRTMAGYTAGAGGVLRLGIPSELPPTMLPGTLARFAAGCPDTRVVTTYLSTAAQFTALRADQLDLGLVRERPPGSEFDTMLAARERLGVLISSETATEYAGADGISLEALDGMEWVGFARTQAPAWFDELTAIFHAHGIDVGRPAPDDHDLIPAVKLMGVGSGGSRAFALAPANWPHPIPTGICWMPLVGHPLVRRTWLAWPAASRRRDLGHFVAALEVVDV